MTAGLVIWLGWELFCALTGVKHLRKYQDFLFEDRELNDLPRRVRAQLERQAPVILRLGFEPLGTYLLSPWPTVAFGTFFISRDGRVFAGIDNWKQLRTRIEALTFMSVLEDGTFYETADMPDPTPNEEMVVPHVARYVPSATPEALHVLHQQGLDDLETQSGRMAMQFQPLQFQEVINYGHLLVNHEAHKKGLKEEPPEAIPPLGFVPRALAMHTD